MAPTAFVLPPMGIGTNAWTDRPGSREALVAVVRAAAAAGAGMLDTAEVYGWGASERAIGALPADLSIAVATKFMPFPGRSGPRAVIRALRASLRRLRRPRVDLYLLHFPRVSPWTWAEAAAEAADRDLARAVGVCNCDRDTLLRTADALALRGLPLAAHQVEYSLQRRAIEGNGVWEACRERGIPVVAHRPFGGGGLLRDVRGRSRLAAELRAVAERTALSPPQVALGWLLSRGAVPIPGCTSAVHAAEDLGALTRPIEAEDAARLERASAG